MLKLSVRIWVCVYAHNIWSLLFQCFVTVRGKAVLPQESLRTENVGVFCRDDNFQRSQKKHRNHRITHLKRKMGFCRYPVSKPNKFNPCSYTAKTFFYQKEIESQCKPGYQQTINVPPCCK